MNVAMCVCVSGGRPQKVISCFSVCPTWFDLGKAFQRFVVYQTTLQLGQHTAERVQARVGVAGILNSAAVSCLMPCANVSTICFGCFLPAVSPTQACLLALLTPVSFNPFNPSSQFL